MWAGRPGDVIHHVNRVLAMFKNPDLTIFCGRLLTIGLRACADLAERARARREVPSAHAAESAAASLAAWTDHMGSAPFTDHPFVATIPAERATWDAERTRLAGTSDPAAWATAARPGRTWTAAPGRIRMVAAGPGTSGRRTARTGGRPRSAGRRVRRRGPRSAAGTDPHPGRASPDPAPGPCRPPAPSAIGSRCLLTG